MPNKNCTKERKVKEKEKRKKCTKPAKTIMHKLNRFISFTFFSSSMFSIFCMPELVFFSKRNCFPKKTFFFVCFLAIPFACISKKRNIRKFTDTCTIYYFTLVFVVCIPISVVSVCSSASKRLSLYLALNRNHFYTILTKKNQW